MVPTMITPGTFLQEILQERKGRNPHFSLRSMARIIGVSPPYLSLVISGRRSISMSRAELISTKLKLPQTERQQFLRCVALYTVRGKARKLLADEIADPSGTGNDFADYATLSNSKTAFLSHWYHPAILDLISCRGFESSVGWISERLGLPVTKIERAVSDLSELGLLDLSQVPWRKTDRYIYYPPAVSERIVREFHSQMCQRVIDLLARPNSEESYASRSVTGMTLAVNRRQLPAARKLISRLERQLVELLNLGDCTEVYHLNVQLFPLTVLSTEISKTPSSRSKL